MKISETTSYPHPVLAPWSTDIQGATIRAEIEFREEVENVQLSISCATTLDQPDIVHLIQEGSAAFGCFIKCQETGLRRLQPFGFPLGAHHFAPGALLGRVSIRPIVWAARLIEGYRPTGTHPEFRGKFDIPSGQILALDDEKLIDVTRPPLASIESIFEIMSSDEVQEGKFEIDTESDRVTVRMSGNTYRLVQSLRQTSDDTRDVIMNSLYVPIVMEVLDQLAEGDEQFEQYRWLHPFRARCELEGIDMTHLNLLNDAQRLLESPFAKLEKLIERAED